MALFSTPDYAGLIWRPQQFSEESGIEGLMSGISGGMQVGSQYKADKKEYEELEDIGPSGAKKPNPFKYYFGQGAANQPVGGSPVSSGPAFQGMDYSGGGQSTSDLVAAIEQLISAMRMQINR
jgi:hypothetical protein